MVPSNGPTSWPVLEAPAAVGIPAPPINGLDVSNHNNNNAEAVFPVNVRAIVGGVARTSTQPPVIPPLQSINHEDDEEDEKEFNNWIGSLIVFQDVMHQIKGRSLCLAWCER